MGRPKKETAVQMPENNSDTATVNEPVTSVYDRDFTSELDVTSVDTLRDQLKAAQLQLAITQVNKKIRKAQLPDIDEAITRVIARVGKVQKNGRNTFHNYDYVKAADIIEEIRKAVASEGITIIPLGIRDEVRTATTGRNGDIITAVIDYKFTGPDGSFKIVPIKSQGQDGGDKAYFKLTTGAMKYLFIQVFLIPQGDDPEDERGRKPEDENAKPWKDKNNSNQASNSNQQSQNNAPAADPAAPAAKPFLGKLGVEKCEKMIKDGQITEAREYLKGYQLSEKANKHLKQVFADHAPKPAEKTPANDAAPAEQVNPPAAVQTPAKEPKPAKEAPTANALPASNEFPNEAPEEKPELLPVDAVRLFKMIDEGKLTEVRAELNTYSLTKEARAAYKERLAAKEAELNNAPAADPAAPAANDGSGPADADLKKQAVDLSKNPAIPRQFKTNMLLKINLMTVNQVNEAIATMQDIIELASEPAQ